MGTDLIDKARRRELSGMNFAILARLSTESKYLSHNKKKAGQASRWKTGLDINSREEQVLDCTNYLTSLGATVVHVYHEPHTSAWKRKRIVLDDGSVIYRVIRPVYQLALQDLRKGIATANGARVDGLMILDVDRLTRDNRDLEDAIDVVVRAHRPILDRRGSLDLLTEQGRTNARVIVSFKAGQSADTAWRMENKHRALQREGIPTGGHRPFGWNEDTRTLHPIESPILQKAAEEIRMRTKSRAAVVSDWNRRGITTARGNKWNQTNLTEVLRNPRMCGYRGITVPSNPDDPNARSRHVVVLYDEYGKPVIGQWEPMITPEEWRDLLDVIGESHQRGEGHNTRKHLLTGTLRHDTEDCGARLRVTKATAKQHPNKPEGFFWYTCPPKNQGGCGGLRIDGPATDAAVIKLVIAKFEREAAEREAVKAPQAWSGQADLDRVLEGMTAAKAARKAGKISAEL
ncbi:MAG TPA: recombinase family protein, partial [Actinocrinis sp.]|nr:recombinase family protein [Actinocrinis sp.]